MLLSGVGGLELLLMCMTDLPWVQHPLKLIVQLLLGLPYLFIYSFTYLLTYSLMFKLARVDFCDLGSEEHYLRLSESWQTPLQDSVLSAQF